MNKCQLLLFSSIHSLIHISCNHLSSHNHPSIHIFFNKFIKHLLYSFFRCKEFSVNKVPALSQGWHYCGNKKNVNIYCTISGDGKCYRKCNSGYEDMGFERDLHIIYNSQRKPHRKESAFPYLKRDLREWKTVISIGGWKNRECKIPDLGVFIHHSVSSIVYLASAICLFIHYLSFHLSLSILAQLFI